jgi:hypothetical protein
MTSPHLGEASFLQVRDSCRSSGLQHTGRVQPHGAAE